jgi:hypothetical protein
MGDEKRRERPNARGNPLAHGVRHAFLVVMGLMFLSTPTPGCVDPGEGVGQATRAISTARLHDSRRFHLPPINVIVSHGPSEGLRPGSAHLGVGFPLRCFQRLSLPDVATRRCPWRDSRYTSGRSIPVLSY